MIRRHATTIALCVLAIGLGVWVWLGERGRVTQAERDLRVRNVFPAFRRDEISRIDVTNPSGRWVLTRPASDAGDGAWSLGESAPEPADDHAVDALVGVLEFATRLRKAETASGVDAPRARGKLVMGRVTWTFALGDPAPTPEGSAYLRVDGEGTFVVTAEVVGALMQSRDAFRSRTVVPYLSLELAKLEVHGKDGVGFAMERMDDVAFRLPALGVRASRERLDGVWLALAELRAESFLPDADADRAVAVPIATVTMTPKDPKRPVGELLLGGPCPSRPESAVLVRRSPTRASACVPGGIAARLVVPAAELADTRLFLARPDEVASIVLAATPAGLTVDLARKGAGWQLRAPDGRELAPDEAEMATALVGSIAHAEGLRFRPRMDTDGALAPRARITLTRSEPPGEEIVELLGGPKGTAWASRKDDGAVSELGPEVARTLTPSVVRLRGRAVWAPPAEANDIKSLVLDCDGTRQELIREKNLWAFGAPAGYAVDAAAAGDVADAMVRLRAESWVAEADDGSFGLDVKCSIVATVAADGAARTLRLVLGRDTAGGLYARADGAAVFVASRVLRDRATRLLVDRAAISVEPNRAERVVLRRGKRSLVLVRAGGKLAADGGSPAAALAHEALLALKADDVVHLGAPQGDEGFADPALELRATYAAGSGARESVVMFGHVVLRRNQQMYLARVSGVDATFAVSKERVQPLVDAP